MTAALAVGRVRAAVPDALAEATVRAAVRIAAGQAAVAEAVSAGVLALAERISRGMSITMARMARGIVLAVGLAAIGVGVWAGQEVEHGKESRRRHRRSRRGGARSPHQHADHPARVRASRDHGHGQGGRGRGRARCAADGLTPDAWYRHLEKERGWSRGVYLNDIVYPNLMAEKLRVIGSFTSLEELKSQSHVEVFFGKARGRSGAKDRDGVRPQQDRLGTVERTLDETIESLESLRRELKR
jgi:hypothetical protein